MDENTLHSGHRKRIFAEFEKNGLEGMYEHQIAELLLFFAIPYKDTNDTAHNLMDKFGSLHNAVYASREELASIDGMGKNTAEFIKQFGIAYYLYNTKKHYRLPYDYNEYMDFCMSYHCQHDFISIVFLDAACTVCGTFDIKSIPVSQYTGKIKGNAKYYLIICSYPLSEVENIVFYFSDTFNSCGLTRADIVIIRDGIYTMKITTQEIMPYTEQVFDSSKVKLLAYAGTADSDFCYNSL